jgi:hypothetical protein
MYKTIIFFMNGPGTPERIPRDDYVGVARGEKLLPQYAGQQVRVADWYVRMDGERPAGIENETYSFLDFDATGHAAWPGKAEHLDVKPKEPAWSPTPEQRAVLQSLVFSTRQRDD